MKKHLARLLSLVLALALLLSMLPAVFAAGVQSNEDKLLDALEAAVAPTNALLYSHQYAPNGRIAMISFDRAIMTADVMIYDTEMRAIKMLEVPFLKTLFSYKDIYAMQIGEDAVDFEGMTQFNIMLAVGHNTIGKGMSYEEYVVWLRQQADTLTISSMDGCDVDITLICRTDRDDPDTEYSVTVNLRLYNRYHKITWNYNNGEAPYVSSDIEVGKRFGVPIPTPPAGMKFYRWDPALPDPMVMGTTDLEFSAIWIPVNHAGFEVRHRLQNADLTGYDLVETEYLSAEKNSGVVGSDMAKTYEGFKLNSLPDNTKTYVITEDGNTKINLYYDRINVRITWDWGFKKVNKNVKYGLMPEAPEMPTPPDDGRDYVFVRWDRALVPATEPTTYHARYADDKMLVLHLDADGGAVPTSELYLYVGDTLGTLPAPTREGYTFLGWFYENGDPVDPARVVEAEGEETAVAHWKINQYTIYFDTEGGTEIEPMTLDYGAVITPPDAPEREGCLFLGWSPLLPYSMPAKTLFVTAQWHIHNIVPDPAVAPTCTTPGKTAGEHCIGCDYKIAQEVIPALGHDFQATAVVTPSCIEDGYTLYTCSRCSATENRDSVPAHGHVWDVGVVTTPATAMTDGVKTFTCTVCGATRTEVIPATGGAGCEHASTHAEHKDAACTEAGYDKTVCDSCGLVLTETVIPALGHDYRSYPAQAATCTEPGWNAYRECTRCHDTDYKEIPAPGHDYVNHAAKAATCTEAGWNAYQTCSRCDYSSYAEIAALGHNIVTDAGKAATCTEAGLTAGEHCTRCDYRIEQTVLPALGHDYAVSALKAATCTEGGSVTYTCSRCSGSYTETLDPLGHDYESFEGKAPTCTEPGWGPYQVCTRCGDSTYQELPALNHGHAYPEHKDPTCTEPGYDRMICDDCGAVISETVLPALGHDVVADPAKAATCTEPGLTAGEHCSRCDYKVAQEVVPALGHDWDEGKITTPATATTDGVKTFTCKRCGETKTEAIPATGGELKNPFVDVGKNDYFYDAVLWAYYAKPQVTNGLDATHFGPYATCTRGQIVTFLWRALGEPAPTITKNPFVDVSTSDYYYKAVLWAYENGVTTGTDATHFAPNAFCKREHAVAFLYRAAGKPEYTNKSNPFTDVSGSAYYYDAVLWAVEKNITNGIDATHFGPSNACQRSQIVTFLYRFMNP